MNVHLTRWGCRIGSPFPDQSVYPSLVGVRGVGLLVFVRSDLEAVVEVNRGQRALDLADAGAQAARRQLRSDAVPEHCDGDGAGNVEWARVAPDGGPGGRRLDLEGGSVRVSIRYLLPSTTVAHLEDAGHAPEPVSGGRRFFAVISEGTVDGARRRVEAILYAQRLSVPSAYYTPDITLLDGVTIRGVGLFAGGDIAGAGGAVINREAPAAYGDWDTTDDSPPSRFNTVPRADAAGTPVTGAGLAAEGMICEDVCSGSPADSAADGICDYDSYTVTRGSHRRFVRKPDPGAPNAPGTISYPFDPGADFDLEFFAEEARRQGDYRSSAVDITNSNYPAPSTYRTVFFVDAGGATDPVEYSVSHSPEARGTIIVRDGNLHIGESSGRFQGRGHRHRRRDGNMYDGSGVKGFVVASGDMTPRGLLSGSAAIGESDTRPGFYGVRLWRWRELYE